MEIIDIKEHYDCPCYLKDAKRGFKIVRLECEEKFHFEDFLLNRLIYVVQGRIELQGKAGCSMMMNQHDFFFVPLGREFSLQARDGSKIIILSTLQVKMICANLSLQQVKGETCTDSPYKSKIFHANEALIRCWTSVDDYISSGLSCIEIHTIKERELFLLLRASLSHEDLNNLLNPIFDRELDFMAGVYKHAQQAKTVKELAEKMFMERSYFQKVFKEHFKQPPYQWLQKLRAERTLELLHDKATPIKSIVSAMGFSSASHLNSFCKKMFQKTAAELKKSE